MTGEVYNQQINAPDAADPTRPFWRVPQISDPAIFDFFNHQADGDARARDARWNTINVALDQRLGRNAGLEVAYDSQYYAHNFSDWAQFSNYAIKLDVTTTLVDGQPNPNYGRLFMSDGMPRAAYDHSREAFRATAYYDLDLKRFLVPMASWRNPGRHTFTANYTRQTNELIRYYGMPMLDLDYWAISRRRTPALLPWRARPDRPATGQHDRLSRAQCHRHVGSAESGHPARARLDHRESAQQHVALPLSGHRRPARPPQHRRTRTFGYQPERCVGHVAVCHAGHSHA